MTNSPSPEIIKEKALKNWSVTKDSCKENLKSSLAWKNVAREDFPYYHSRPLTQETAQKAIKYIAVLVKKYPVQLRFTMALPLWRRFAQEWCDTGNETKALMAI